MWVVYFALSKKDPNLSSIEADTWLEVYGKSGGSKLKNFLRERGISWCISNMNLPANFDTADLNSAKKKFLPKDKGGLDWHNALKNQVVNFRKHQKGKISFIKYV